MKDRMYFKDGRERVYYLTELKGRRRDLRQKSTYAEELLWKELRNNKLGVKFRRQFSVRGYVVDFYCPKYRLAIEILGGIHNTKSVMRYDKYRNEYISAFGIKILEFRNKEVESEIGKVIDTIKIHLTPLVPLSTIVERG